MQAVEVVPPPLPPMPPSEPADIVEAPVVSVPVKLPAGLATLALAEVALATAVRAENEVKVAATAKAAAAVVKRELTPEEKQAAQLRLFSSFYLVRLFLAVLCFIWVACASVRINFSYLFLILVFAVFAAAVVLVMIRFVWQGVFSQTASDEELTDADNRRLARRYFWLAIMGMFWLVLHTIAFTSVLTGLTNYANAQHLKGLVGQTLSIDDITSGPFNLFPLLGPFDRALFVLSLLTWIADLGAQVGILFFSKDLSLRHHAHVVRRSSQV